MGDNYRADRVIEHLIGWGNERPAIQAMLLTSTRARPDAQVDLFSDYDVILAVRDIRPFYEDRSWLGDFGRVLVVYRDPVKLEYGQERFAYITQYEDGLKIDFTLWSEGIVQRIAALAALPDELDVGYSVLLDKENLTAGLQPPTYRAHIPKPPSLEAYQDVIESFFHEATYTAKHLWRGDLMAAKHNLDAMMKVGDLRVMLECGIEIDHDWSVKTGAYGRGIQNLLRPEIWTELQRTYVGYGESENWEALFGMIDLFRKAAVEVGEYLGYEYPHELHKRAVDYLRKVQHLDRNAQSFPD